MSEEIFIQNKSEKNVAGVFLIYKLYIENRKKNILSWLILARNMISIYIDLLWLWMNPIIIFKMYRILKLIALFAIIKIVDSKTAGKL